MDTCGREASDLGRDGMEENTFDKVEGEIKGMGRERTAVTRRTFVYLFVCLFVYLFVDWGFRAL